MRDASVATTSGSSSGNDTLFLATSRALAGLRPRGGLLNRFVGMFPDRVVGVFPEGTSYTEPYIMQVKEGAAWAALEYSRWKRENAASDGQAIKIIPVGIAYTDKTQYLSRVGVIQNRFLFSQTLSSGILAGLRAVGILCMMEINSQLIFTPSYGEPLILADLEDEYHSAIESGDNQRARAVATELTTRIARELSRLSIIAPNW
jgi:hypothetical protein